MALVGIVALRGAGGDSCYGVALEVDLLLTTSSCARASEYATHGGERRQVQRVMYPPRRARDARTTAPRGLALLLLSGGNFDALPLVSLLSIDGEQLLGTRVLVSGASRSTSLTHKTVRRCMFEVRRSGGANICTTADRKDNCSLQGIPLFKDKRVIALSDKQKFCNIQRVFISVGSSIPWINSVLRYSVESISEPSVKRNNANRSILPHNDHNAQSQRAAVRAKEVETSQSTKGKTATKLKPKPVTRLKAKRPFTFIMKKGLQHYPKSCSRIDSSLNLTEDLMVTRIYEHDKFKKKIASNSHKNMNTRTVNSTRTTRRKKGIFYGSRNAPTVKRMQVASTDDSLMSPRSPTDVFSPPLATTPSAVGTTKRSHPDNRLKGARAERLLSNASTDALAWFKQLLAEQDGPPPVLVLTTTKPIQLFVDLT